MNPLPMPFQRQGDPYIMPATTTPQSYIIPQPAGSRSYRGVNPCINADVRVKTVSATAPITTQPVVVNGKTIPNVLRVTSATEAVTEFTGTLFVSRAPETLGSTPTPDGSLNRVVSIMIVGIPGYAADLSSTTCLFNLGYGNGGGG